MIRHYNQSPVVGFWFAFWHDVWNSNQDIPEIRKAADLLDPLQPSSICYKPMSRKKLDAFLGGKSILGKKHSVWLDSLYARCKEIMQSAPRAPIVGGNWHNYVEVRTVAPNTNVVINVQPPARVSAATVVPVSDDGAVYANF